jgi:spore germination protein YaaH
VSAGLKIEYNRLMKRFFILALIILIGAFIILHVVRAKVRQDIDQPVYQPALTPAPTVTIDRLQNTNTSLFVPNWTLDSITDSFDQYIYFGITPTKEGINATASGTKDSKTFLKDIPHGKRKLLALEMQNTDVNAAILQNKTLQLKVISQTVSMAKANGFSGIVLNLEMGGIPFSSLIDEINSFTQALNAQAKAYQLQLAVTLYGDTFYRMRPFDVKHIAANSDSIMIMAYDFHKARSNPGPNFPLGGQNMYGYDIGKMSDDFLQVVPNLKLNVIFGLFGYDWPVDIQGNAVGQGQPLTNLQIQNKFLNNCSFQDCQIKRDTISAETVIHYTDKDKQKHIVWFEDTQSVMTKEQYLRKRGIGNFSFWANSYF